MRQRATFGLVRSCFACSGREALIPHGGHPPTRIARIGSPGPDRRARIAGARIADCRAGLNSAQGRGLPRPSPVR